MPKPPAPCGTIGAYKRHIRYKEKPDAACLAANTAKSAEMRDGRLAHQKDLARKRAESRAKTRLVHTYWHVFDTFYQEELLKEPLYSERETEQAGGNEDSTERIPLHVRDQQVATDSSHPGGAEDRETDQGE